MDDPPGAPRRATGRGRRPWLRRCLAGASLLLAIAAWTQASTHGRQRARLTAPFDPAGGLALPDDLAPRLQTEPDLARVRIALARALVTAELDPRRRPAETSPETSRERLHLARQLATEALVARPAAWQAPLFLGAATYLGHSLARDPRLFTDVPAWEQPLELAQALAPGKPEASRFLVTAYLELWPALSDGKQERTLELLQEAFADLATFERLAEPWLSVAPDREAAFRPVPEDPAAWQILLQRFARGGDWDGYRAARERHDAALERQLERDLATARRLAEGGQGAGARHLYLSVLARAPRDRTATTVVAQVLAELPAGPAPRDQAAGLAAWLEWSLDLCLLADCPLPPTALDRLTSLVDGLPPHLEARGRLAAGRLVDAERLERRFAAPPTLPWGDYFLTKARVLLAGHRFEEAVAALAQVPPSTSRDPRYHAVASAVAEARSDEAAAHRSHGALRELAQGPWGANAWRLAGPALDGPHSGTSTPVLELAVLEPAAGLEVVLLAVPEGGAVLEPEVDGYRQRPQEVRAGQRLVIPAALGPGVHRITLHTAAGGNVTPGTARILH